MKEQCSIFIDAFILRFLISDCFVEKYWSTKCHCFDVEIDFWGVGNGEVVPDIKGRIPLINWVQAGDWIEIAKEFAYEDALKSGVKSQGKHEGGFQVLRVKGDSMEKTAEKNHTRGAGDRCWSWVILFFRFIGCCAFGWFERSNL